MKKKLIGVFGVCFLLSMTLVSALSVENVEASYDRKEKVINIRFDKVLVNECGTANVAIINRKGEVVGGNSANGFVICKLIYGGRIVKDFSQTGIFSQDYEFDIGSERGLRRHGRLRYEITDSADGRLLAKGRVR